MKIAVINLSGNTGKTTLSKHLLAPLLSARRVQIENVNMSDGEPDMELSAGKFRLLAVELNAAEDDVNFVIDIGASNAMAVIAHFSSLKSTRAAIDFWVVPVVPPSKQRADSINTVATLMKIGVDPKKIVMVINNVADLDSFEHDFAAIFGVGKLGVHVAAEAVLSSDVYELLKNDNDSVFDLADNRPDFKALFKAARAAGDDDGVTKIAERMLTQDLAEEAAENLRAVFASTPIGQSAPALPAIKPAKTPKVAA